MRILILDDMDTRHEGFKKRLAGHELHHVRSVNEANTLLDTSERFDVAYLDHDLGEVGYAEGVNDGMAVVDHIIAMEPDKRPETVIVHSHNHVKSKEMVLRLREAGVEAGKQPYTA